MDQRRATAQRHRAELVYQAARLSLAIERGERIETAHLTGRVRAAVRERTQQVNPQRLEEVHELGRRLLYIAGPEEVKVNRMPLWADDPAVLVSKLEASAEGCRWLVQRWAEYRNLLDHKSHWEEAVLLRFVRLQGKQVIESVYDPVLNSIFLAWDVLVPKDVRLGWQWFQEDWPKNHPTSNHWLLWREIAPRPGDTAAAWAVFYAVVDRHVERLKELLAAIEASEAEEDPDWADRAAFDGSPAFERHRRYQSAKTRELHRTLDTLRKMRNSEFGTGNEEEELADGEGPMAIGEGPMADGECPVPEGGCDQGLHSELMTEGSFDPVVEHDSQPVTEDATDEGAHAGGQPEQSEARQRLPEPSISPSQWLRESRIQNPGSKMSVRSQKAPNEPKLESMQNVSSQGVEPENAEPAGRERSQSATGGQVVHGSSKDRVENDSAGVKDPREGSGPQRLFATQSNFGHSGLLGPER